MAMFQRRETFFGLPSELPSSGCRAALFGVPFDSGSHPFRIGAREGPAEVRRQSRLIRRFHPEIADFDVLDALKAVDCGDVKLVPGRPIDAFPAVEAAVRLIFDVRAVPIAVGGDGAVSLPLMRETAKHFPNLVALHVDSHTDAHPYSQYDRYHPATQFTHAAEEQLIDAKSSWHIGVRGFTYDSGMISHTQDLGFRVVFLHDLIRRGFSQTIAEFSDAASGRPVYLCWDMDVFDPSCAPGVCTPVWGGLSAREGIEVMRAFRGLNIVAADFNTVSPSHDINGMTSHLCAHMMMELALLLVQEDI